MIRTVSEHELAHFYLVVAYKKSKKKEAINEWETVLKLILTINPFCKILRILILKITKIIIDNIVHL